MNRTRDLASRSRAKHSLRVPSPKLTIPSVPAALWHAILRSPLTFSFSLYRCASVLYAPRPAKTERATATSEGCVAPPPPPRAALPRRAYFLAHDHTSTPTLQSLRIPRDTTALGPTRHVHARVEEAQCYRFESEDGRQAAYPATISKQCIQDKSTGTYTNSASPCCRPWQHPKI